MPADFCIRPAETRDLEQIAAIYNHEAITGIATFDIDPQPVDHWQALLNSTHPGDHLLVAVESADQVLGYAGSSPYRTRPAYHRTRETSVYLHREARGRGVGSALYVELLDLLCAASMHTALALIAQPNPASERLHESLGFEKVGTVREVGHKFDRYIDIVWYQKLLTD